MPLMDGFMLVEQIRKQPTLARTPIIMMTSAGQPGDMARCRQLNVERYLVKPVRHSELRDAILASLSNGADPIPPQAPAAPTAATPPARQLRILVADDNVINQKVLKRMLEKLGHVVALAANGQEAIDAVSTETYDVVLMDVQMPVMDGIAATATIRAREQVSHAHMPIVAVTADAMQGDKERFLAAGMDGYISKPIGRAELIATLAAAVPASAAAL
jgi:CheY-like chemotaxis protein